MKLKDEKKSVLTAVTLRPQQFRPPGLVSDNDGKRAKFVEEDRTENMLGGRRRAVPGIRDPREGLHGNPARAVTPGRGLPVRGGRAGLGTGARRNAETAGAAASADQGAPATLPAQAAGLRRVG